MIEKCYVVPVQKTCNCNCEFCISKVRSYDKQEEFLIPNSEFQKNIQLLSPVAVVLIQLAL